MESLIQSLILHRRQLGVQDCVVKFIKALGTHVIKDMRGP